MASQIKRRIDADVEDEIREIALTETKTPAQIYRHLDGEKKFVDRVPSRRTVERMVRELRSSAGDTSPWTLAAKDIDEEAARLVLRSRRALILRHEKPLHRFNISEAKWVAKISKIAPDLAPDIAWLIGKVYSSLCRRVDERGDDDFLTALDDYLAFAPWRDAEHYRLYLKAVEQGWVLPAPMWSRLVEQQNPSGRPQTFA